MHQLPWRPYRTLETPQTRRADARHRRTRYSREVPIIPVRVAPLALSSSPDARTLGCNRRRRRGVRSLDGVAPATARAARVAAGCLRPRAHARVERCGVTHDARHLWSGCDLHADGARLAFPMAAFVGARRSANPPATRRAHVLPA